MGRRRASASLAGALALHGALIALVTWRVEPIRRLLVAEDPPASEPAPAPQADDGPTPVLLTSVDELPLLSVLPVPVVLGPADAIGGDTHPLPGAEADLPGDRAASLGGGAEGGTETWTGRRDREELRAQSWNSPDRYRLPRTDTGDRRTSNESIARAPERGFDDRSQPRRRQARRGQPAAPAADPDGREAPAQVEGALDPAPRKALVTVGDAATEAERDGPTVDDTDAVAASNERHPGVFEMTRPRAGGGPDGGGVAGAVAADGVSAHGSRANDSTAALRAALRRAPAAPTSMRAARHDPYFRNMYARLDRLIEYPRALALRMDQGEVVVRFTLHADGSVGDVAVEKSSGFDEFDDQVTRAVSRGAPFGRVPAEIIGSRAKITVRAPYAFRNPLIR